MKNGCLILFDGEVQCGLRWIAPKRIGGEQSISSRVPVSRVTWILRAVEYCNGHRVSPVVSSERAPSPACRPDSFSLDALARQVLAGCVFSIGGIYLCRSSAGVHKNTALFIGRFKPVDDTHSEQPFLVVIENARSRALRVTT